jgi:L-aspartate oxidase
VLDQDDSVDAHIADTMAAGAGLCDPAAVRYTVEHGAAAIGWLIDLGVPFTREEKADGRQDYHLTREGGHRHRRVIHAADATGRAIENSLEAETRRRENIDLYERHIAVDLITSAKLGLQDPRCLGAYVLDRESGHVEVFRARSLVLASGGASKVYLYTSNPDTASGDGIAMAWRAGCRVANMEFNQFHPTCLYHPLAKSFLITEAVRGEGGRLLLPDGTRFMPASIPAGELAPRDIVARAIDHEMKRLGIDHVLLDISHKPAAFIIEHFPTVYAAAWNWARHDEGPIPVVPAAHYTCGGIRTDLQRPHRCARPVRHRRVRPHRPARRQPHGQQLPAGMPGVRPIRQRGHPGAAGGVPLPPTCRPGTNPGHRFRRGGGGQPQLGRAAALHVGLRGHRAHRQAAPAGAPARRAAAAGNTGILQ